MADKLILFSTTGGGSGPRQYASTDDAFEAGALPGKVAGKVASGDTSPGMAVLFTQSVINGTKSIVLSGTGKFRVIDAWMSFSGTPANDTVFTLKRKVGATVDTVATLTAPAATATLLQHIGTLVESKAEFSADNNDEMQFVGVKGAGVVDGTAYVLAVRTE